MYKIKLPSDFEIQFGSGKTEECPYTKFYRWATQQLPEPSELRKALYDEFNEWGLPVGVQPDVSKFRLHPKDYNKLTKIVRNWFIAGESNFRSLENISSRATMLEFQLAPSKYSEDNPFLEKIPEPGYVYINKVWWTKVNG